MLGAKIVSLLPRHPIVSETEHKLNSRCRQVPHRQDSATIGMLHASSQVRILVARHSVGIRYQLAGSAIRPSRSVEAALPWQMPLD